MDFEKRGVQIKDMECHSEKENQNDWALFEICKNCLIYARRTDRREKWVGKKRRTELYGANNEGYKMSIILY